ncbi:IS66 family insertion sequence element accessory protein TnpB [Ferruginibacter sp.]|uniref:IS66 family insertion sequence element accessory protein TnpB n=1 Tax=Ferruginibacter sp. TaxID=1940288 RepID=UPI0019AF4177|nr:IS66 family insertion sequence element accessory protein TnpB [Ferruginibacter sp.]MBC7627087.1 IS66 family insertion sequence element accessory protein TnpB [Ferruginibacter sp.]
MLHLNSATASYWYNGAADMRKGFHAFCGIVQQHMQGNILQGGVYIFVNRKRWAN